MMKKFAILSYRKKGKHAREERQLDHRASSIAAPKWTLIIGSPIRDDPRFQELVAEEVVTANGPSEGDSPKGYPRFS